MAVSILGALIACGTVAFLGITLYFSHKKNSPFLLYLATVIYNFAGSLYLFSSYPVAWAEPGISQLLAMTLVILIPLLFGSLPSLFLYYSFDRFRKLTLFPFIFGIAVMATDAARMLFITLINGGESSHLGLNFISGSFGESLTLTPLVIFSYGGGLLFLSFFVGLLVGSFFNRNGALLAAPFILIWFLLLHIPAAKETPEVTVNVVTTAFSDRTVEPSLPQKFDTLRNLSKNLPEATVTLFPENSHFLTLSQLFSSSSLVSSPFIFDSSFYSITPKSVGAFLYAQNDEVLLGRKKVEIMPYSEYYPYFAIPFLKATLTKSQYRFLIDGRYSSGGEGTKRSFQVNSLRVASVICSEATSLSAHYRIARERPDILFLQSNLSTFQRKPLASLAVESYIRLLAATVRVPLISAHNDFTSFIISASGKTLFRLPAGDGTYTFSVNSGKILFRE